MDKLPQALREIINDPEKRKKLIILMNPPYAEAGTATTVSGTGKNKAGVSDCYIKNLYNKDLGKATNEVFALFLIRIYKEIKGCVIGEFSKLKALQGENFEVFRANFKAQLKEMFVVPSETFDNVKGQFPIGFKIWDTKVKEEFSTYEADVLDKKGIFIGKKRFKALNIKSINEWVKKFKSESEPIIGYLPSESPDFQNNSYLFISRNKRTKHVFFNPFTKENLIPLSIYFSVRKVIPATWLNDRDQFLTPKGGWQEDSDFQNDCLVYTLFHSSNTIKSEEGINHWIPFSEKELEVFSAFESDFMVKFIQGKLKKDKNQKEGDLSLIDNENNFIPSSPLIFSEEAQDVLNRGKSLYLYYHAKAKEKRDSYNINASFYDIKLFFQGKNEKNRMNSQSQDPEYNHNLSLLSASMKLLAKKIEVKVYDYQFLLE